MEPTAVAVLSRREGLLSQLEKRGERFVFGSPELLPEAIVVILDREQIDDSVAGPYLARIILDEEPVSDEREAGDLVIDPQSFLRNPDPVLLICRDVAKSRKLVTQLLGELEFSQHVQELIATPTFDGVAERIVHTALEMLDATAGTLLLLDPRIERFVVAFSNDVDYRDDGNFVPGVEPGLLEEALAAQDGLAIGQGGARQVLVIPVQVAQDLIGILRVTGRPNTSLDGDRARKTARYVDSITAIVGNLYQLTRSNELAMRDDLTKAYNRRFFEIYLDEEVERSRRYGTFFSIIFLDLDELKKVNNLYGHLAGSRTLQEVAKRILGAVRTIDKVVRFGGDEFCIILPQTDQTQALAVSNRVRKAMVQSAFRIESEVQVDITASFGIATFPIHAATKEDLIRQADAAMYRVKSTTKNSVGMAEPLTQTRRQA
ncbi:MAG TPA: sensor domain-containing diguanylate cyclase [Thermoanaerobaculia bacterium]|nr:sensor domain-containing diguanylate cyclase [Thermoanaerobaculia bacterium]